LSTIFWSYPAKDRQTDRDKHDVKHIPLAEVKTARHYRDSLWYLSMTSSNR